jgi:hypothetical protein
MAAGVAWWAHIGGFAFGALFALVLSKLMGGEQTRIIQWSDHGKRVYGRRVPDIKPRDWQ